MTDEIIIRSYQEGFAALDMLQHAVCYLKGQYRDEMTRDAAFAHFEARQILLRREEALLNELELEYLYGGKG